MVQIPLSLSDAHAVEVYGAVGKRLSTGDVTPDEGESIFGAAVAAILDAYVNPPATTEHKAAATGTPEKKK